MYQFCTSVLKTVVLNETRTSWPFFYREIKSPFSIEPIDIQHQVRVYSISCFSFFVQKINYHTTLYISIQANYNGDTAAWPRQQDLVATPQTPNNSTAEAGMVSMATRALNVCLNGTLPYPTYTHSLATDQAYLYFMTQLSYASAAC